MCADLLDLVVYEGAGDGVVAELHDVVGTLRPQQTNALTAYLEHGLGEGQHDGLLRVDTTDSTMGLRADNIQLGLR